jgi:hypothetical protein
MMIAREYELYKIRLKENLALHRNRKYMVETFSSEK